MVEPFDDDNDNREPAELIAGRFVGILVFLAGIVLLVITFLIAYKGFQSPDWLIPQVALTHKPALEPSVVYISAIIRLILLFAMGYFASLIASRGAQFYFSARREVRHRGIAGG